MKIKYKGYIIIQSSYNNHIMIIKDNKMVMHISTNKPYTKEELKELVDINLLLVGGLDND